MIIDEEQRRGISEEDISKLLKRYSVNTILTLLQEVANYCDSGSDSSACTSFSITDWNFLAANTSTPLSDPTDYHSLWRLLAPHPPDKDHLDDPQPRLDPLGDHDHFSATASAYVKLHIASASLKDDPYTHTIEAPLIIQHSDKYFTVPVFVPKQHSFPSLEHPQQLDANSSSSLASRRKRKPWTSSEDAELIAAVHKFGEGNWSNILKQDFKGDRTATQLSQRWGIIRKRRGNSNVFLSTSSLPQLSEVQLAARKAISAALDFPVGNLRSLSSIATAGSISDNIEVAQTQYQTQQATAPTSSRVGSLCSSTTKTQLPSTMVSTKRCMSPNSMVKATAVAAGARIATPEDAASLLKAAQANNAVHIMPGAASLIKSCATPPISTTHLGAHKNVHFLSTGKSVTPKESKPLSAKPIVQSMNVTDLPSKQDAKTANFPTKQVQEDNPTTYEMQVDEGQTAAEADGIFCPSSNETDRPIQDDEESIVNDQSTLHRKQVSNIDIAGKDFTQLGEGENGNFDEKQKDNSRFGK